MGSETDRLLLSAPDAGMATPIRSVSGMYAGYYGGEGVMTVLVANAVFAGSHGVRGGAIMATMGLARLLPKPQRSYQVHKDEPSPVTLARLQVSIKGPML